MEKNYQEIVDELFGNYYKHRTLRTVFDPYSSEWNDTSIEEKIKILEKIINSNKISLKELISSYKWFYTETLTNKSHVIDSLEDSLIILLQKKYKQNMDIKFNIDKIVSYLNKYKNNLPQIYKWKSNTRTLVELEVLTRKQEENLNSLTPFKKEIELKNIVGKQLNIAFNSNSNLFNKLCLWIINDWGGIKTANDDNTIKLIGDFLESEKPDFNRIASASKVGAYLYPERNIIYDSRVAYSLNWIILSENAGKYFFPIPEGRNSKMSAFDLNVLIRLKNIRNYQPKNINELDNRLFINNADKNIFISKKDAYFELRNLIKEINSKLWKGNIDMERKLFYTEMLLFSIADREIFMDITNEYNKINM